MDCAIPGDTVADAIANSGFWVGEHAIRAPLLARLRDELFAQDAANALTPAAVGRGQARRVDTAIRGDRICWLEPTTGPVRQLFDALDALRVALNRVLFLSLVDQEAHFAIYSPDTGYERHLDRFGDRSSGARRAVSFVVYLNEDWLEADGGHLVLYRDDAEIARIRPSGGTLVVFSSAEVPHEVLPAARARASVAGWFRQP